MHGIIGVEIGEVTALPPVIEVTLFVLLMLLTLAAGTLMVTAAYERLKVRDLRIRRGPKQIHGHTVRKSYAPWFPLTGKYQCTRCGESKQYKKKFMEGKRCEQEVNRFD